MPAKKPPIAKGKAIPPKGKAVPPKGKPVPPKGKGGVIELTICLFVCYPFKE